MSASWALKLYRHELLFMITLIFLTLKCIIRRRVLQYTSSCVVSTWWCSTMLQSWSAMVAVQKLSWTLEWPWRSSCFLVRMLTWLESSQFFLWECLKTKFCASTVDNKEELWYKILQFTSEIENTLVIFQNLRVSFSCTAGFCVH
jgi:hypothetical protein